MTEQEITEAVWVLYNKGYTTDYGDTDYFIDGTDEDIEKGYEFLEELENDGKKAFAKKYSLSW